MMKWKKIGMNILFPSLWIVIVLVMVSAVGLLMILMSGQSTHPVSICFYVLSFYSLVLLCLALWKTVPKEIVKIKESKWWNLASNHRLVKRYGSDKTFKTTVKLDRSLIINVMYIGLNLYYSFKYRTRWFAIFAVYYALLAMIRFLLVEYLHHYGLGENRLKELKRARLCASFLLFINLILSASVLMMIFFQKRFEYQGIMIYVMAMYVFYMLISSGVELITYRKMNSPIMTMSVMTKLAAALVSLLSLETAMFAQFGQDMSFEHQKLMIILTGAGVALVIVGLASWFVVKTTHEIDELRRDKHE